MIKIRIVQSTILLLIFHFCQAQNVPILSYDVNNFGQVQLEIEASADKYYLLSALHQPNLSNESITSITKGIDGNMFISESLAAYPIQSYKITAHSIEDPADSDGDGIDDLTELDNMPEQAPLNYAEKIPIVNGSTSIDSKELYSELAVINEDIPWAPFLNNQEFAKFAILNQNSDHPEIYFVNSKTHYIHAEFYATIDITNDEITSGEIVYNPNEILPNGVIGSFSFNYSFGASFSFEHTQRTFELLAANMPFLRNNFKHFIGNLGETQYTNIYKDSYEGSRINVVLESELFSDYDYLPFNQAEGFGYFRKMDLDENPGSRDIVLYDALPNSLPRVGGIITSVIQTPLSHVNLRAIQDNVPNAYIKEPLEIDSIANLIGKYIYYKVDDDHYEIREASLEEVNEWYEKLRPSEEQIPERDLSVTSILPLDQINFDMANAFGAKCSNVATMRTFGFPDGTIPNGFGIPFYFYDEFMKFNGFYERVEDMIADPAFISDLETRIDMLKAFRKEIKEANMPQWMLDELQAMHDSFPEGTAVRCRSSTNNEDLPGFSGAGLYTSKTQHLDEGHISKSVKQVYASIWNFRAYDERDFYRVDHFIAAMGILCHPNYQEEKSNGVGVSIDPIYQTDNTFYLNTQVGEALITNPNADEIPEEILLNKDTAEGYFVLRYSNLVPDNELVMGETYLDEMRDYLSVIHDKFEILYDVVGAKGFGMDIEYKVTSEDQLIIKQARPWVSFWSEIKSNFDLGVTELTNPKTSSTLGNEELISARVSNQGLRAMKDFELSLYVENQLIETLSIEDELSPQSSTEYQFTMPQDFSVIGDYSIMAIVDHPTDGYDKNDTLQTTVSKVHYIEAGIFAELKVIKCEAEMDVIARVTNFGEATFNNTEIEVVVNGIPVDTVNYDFSIPYLDVVDIVIHITDNLQQLDNEIVLNLLSINGEQDALEANNSSSFTTDLNSDYDFITLVINPDDYPEETSWALFDESTNNLVASGGLSQGDEYFSESICVNYKSCLTLFVYDTFSDGFCCEFGMGNFMVQSATGDTLVSNNGQFESQVEERFCPGGECTISAVITTTPTTNENTTDGTITINASNGAEPYQYSIDGGQSFFPNNIFENLAPDIYMIVVQDTTENCIYEDSIQVEMGIANSINELSSTSINVYPNPTSGDFTITLNDHFEAGEEVKIEIYNALGKEIQNRSVLKSSKKMEMLISLNNYPSGSYIVKCYNEHFERNFNIIKI